MLRLVPTGLPSEVAFQLQGCGVAVAAQAVLAADSTQRWPLGVATWVGKLVPCPTGHR